MRVAIQGESQLQSMPNNTAIMISFAACFALTLGAHAAGDSALAPSIQNLIEEVATVLIRIGSVTSHRNGLSVLYGRYLKQIVKRAAGSTALPEDIHGRQAPVADNVVAASGTIFNQQDGGVEDTLWPQTFQFSSMSDDQILQILNEPANDLEPSFGGLSWEDMTNFDWLHWPGIGTLT
jgi:cell division protein YceG involved in septum cleavage